MSTLETPPATYQSHSSLAVMVSTILGSSLAFIDGSIVNVAQGAIGRDLKMDSAALVWVVEAYLLLVAALILVSGALGDRYGYRRMFGLGVLIFTVASILCALSSSGAVLIGARALQGVGGALLTPNSLALLSASSEGAARGRAIGTWSALTSVAGVIGPLLGGWLIGALSWHAAFWINVPLAAVVLALLYFAVPTDEPSKNTSSSGSSRMPDLPSADLPGAVLAMLGLGGVVYGLIEAGSKGFGPLEVWLPLLLGAVFMAAFLGWEARTKHPMLPLSLFKSRLFSGANLLTFLLYGALGAVGYFVPQNLLLIQGFSPLEAGAALLPLTVLLGLLSRSVGGMAAKRGPRAFLTLGPILTGVGLALLALPGVGANYWSGFLPGVTMMGLGMALVVSPLVSVIFATVDVNQSGIASGVNTAVARAASLMAIAGLGLLVTTGFSSSLSKRLENLNTPPQIRSALVQNVSKLAALEVPKNTAPALKDSLEAAIKSSYVDGYRQMMLLAALLALLSGAVGWFSSPSSVRNSG